MPTPSYAAPQTASPGTASTAARIRATRSRWPTAYCGSPPPQRWTWVSTGRDGEPGRVAQVGERPGDQLLVGGLERRLLAVPAQGGAQQEQPVAGRAHPAPLGEGEGRGLDPAPLDRRHQEARGVGRRRARATDAAAKAKVTTAIEADSMPASSAAAAGATAPSSRAVGAAGVASTTASASTSSGRVVGPTVRREPGGGRAPAPARSRRCGRSSPRPAPRAADPSRRGCPRRPAGRTSSGIARLVEHRPAAGVRDQLGHRRARRDQPRVAGVHPAEQRLDEPVGDLGPEPAVDQVADRDVAVDAARAAAPARGEPRSSPSGESTPDAASWSRSSGTPISERGSGRSEPRVQIRDDATVGCSIGRPELAGEVDALGSAVEHRLGADVDGHPGDLGAQQLAADPGRRLEDEHVVPGRGQVAGGRQPGDAGADDHDRCACVPRCQTGAGQAARRPAARSRCGGRPAAARCRARTREPIACSWSSTIVWSPASTSR